MTELPPALAKYADLVSASIRQASPLSREATRRNGPENIAAVENITVEAEERTLAGRRLAAAIDALCTELARHPFNDAARVERLRESALASHQAWVETMQSARPNDMARSMGLDWAV